MTDRVDPIDLLELDHSSVRDEDLETFRPSLVKLTRDLRGLRGELLEGFPSRRDLLFWLQRLAVRSLGELPQRYYREFGRQFRISRVAGEHRQGVLLAALLHPRARDRDLVELFRNEDGEIVLEELDPEYTERIADDRLEAVIVDRFRGRLAASMIRPAQNRAYRQLRKEATEYVDESDEGKAHDPRAQEHPAMRPSLGELDEWQSAALGQLLEGFDSIEAVVDWGDVVEQATNGEINETAPAERIGGDFIQRCYEQRSARGILTGEGRRYRRAREVMAARFLCPAFNLAVREQLGRAGELPETEQTRTEAKQV